MSDSYVADEGTNRELAELLDFIAKRFPSPAEQNRLSTLDPSASFTKHFGLILEEIIVGTGNLSRLDLRMQRGEDPLGSPGFGADFMEAVIQYGNSFFKLMNLAGIPAQYVTKEVVARWRD
jgi:hypothetical protein